ncbi:MAG: hypothetical protein IJT16_13035 [Lachnospiraceae bacterium]|nr:hypothetical protein [Lachnospiraceae bacterium]
MLGRKKELPVYFFAGFLESGKTSFIKETMKEGQFQDGYKTAYIVCEEGVEEIGKKELEENKFELLTIESEDEIEYGTFLDIDRRVKPDRVIIEYNGTWDPDLLMEALPEHWLLAECITTIDASQYDAYLGNMKQMMTRQFTYADLVVFNRCTPSLDLPYFKRTVKALNRRAQVIFEMTDGSINNNVVEELPYDLNAPVIEVADDDYGIWYVDTFDNLDKYVGKTVKFKGMVHKAKRGINDYFIPGRFAMTCCAEDIQFFGFPCVWSNVKSLHDKEYVTVTAQIKGTMNREYGQETPILYASSVEKAQPAAEEVVYLQ